MLGSIEFSQFKKKIEVGRNPDNIQRFRQKIGIRGDQDEFMVKFHPFEGRLL